ncbi:MAG TPA: AgmX/PglI C-terminal domain-containing protein [Anaeromyxobacteraceae bacterium]|nr:AgmX/PglI C-terminal domain-containing protein [Anaeromyxobacteraceae bacterium]
MADDSTPQTKPTREWLFKSDGQVFGPVVEGHLVELVMQGRLGPETEVAGEEGRWRALSEVPGFLVHIRKAEARARIEKEVTGARNLARRRGAVRLLLYVATATVLCGGVSAGAYLLATRRPWQRESALLANFGDGITIGAVSIHASRRAAATDAEDEIAVPDPSSSASPVRSRHSPGGPPATRPAASNPHASDLVLSAYDPARIQQSVARQRGALAPCLREEAARSPEFSGEIPIEFAIGNEGRVVALWIDEPRFKSGALRDCLLARLSEFTFDKFPGERPVVSLSLRIAR